MTSRNISRTMRKSMPAIDLAQLPAGHAEQAWDFRDIGTVGFQAGVGIEPPWSSAAKGDIRVNTQPASSIQDRDAGLWANLVPDLP